MYGITLRWFSNSLSNFTARSRIIGKLLIGSTVMVSLSISETLVKHAKDGLPFIFIPQLPQVACRQEYRTAME
jgi:hypothetical protein